MKKWFVFLFIFSLVLVAEEIVPKHLSETEKNEIIEKYGQDNAGWEIVWGRYLESLRGQYRFSPPKGDFFSPAEFEISEGVCLSWTGYTQLLSEMAKEIALDAKVFIVTSSPGSVRYSLEKIGCNMKNVVFIEERLNSVWMRDYGPWFIEMPGGKKGIIDLVYNRPRPLDDKFPKTLGDKFGWETFACPLILPGGNLIIDGHGAAIMTDVVFDAGQGGDPNLSMEQLKRYMKDYFHCDTVHVVQDMENDGTGHIDMFCKLLDDRNIIIGEYKTPMDGYGNNYYILNEVAEKMAQLKNGKGENFVVHRMPMPSYKWGVSYTHTNSLIVNNKVLVPVYGRGTDEEALAIYKKLMPNHKIVGLDCNDIIGANGAIHCITKLVMGQEVETKE